MMTKRLHIIALAALLLKEEEIRENKYYKTQNR